MILLHATRVGIVNQINNNKIIFRKKKQAYVANKKGVNLMNFSFRTVSGKRFTGYRPFNSINNSIPFVVAVARRYSYTQSLRSTRIDLKIKSPSIPRL